MCLEYEVLVRIINGLYHVSCSKDYEIVRKIDLLTPYLKLSIKDPSRERKNKLVTIYFFIGQSNTYIFTNGFLRSRINASFLKKTGASFPIFKDKHPYFIEQRIFGRCMCSIFANYTKHIISSVNRIVGSFSPSFLIATTKMRNYNSSFLDKTRSLFAGSV